MENNVITAEEFLKTKNIYVFDGKEGFVQTNFDVIKKSMIETHLEIFQISSFNQ